MLSRKLLGTAKLQKTNVDYSCCLSLLLDSVGTHSPLASLKTVSTPVVFHENRDFAGNHEFRPPAELGVSRELTHSTKEICIGPDKGV